MNGSESDDDDASSASTLTVENPEIDENGALLSLVPLPSPTSSLDWTLAFQKRTDNPLSCSFDGTVYRSLGCFPIGLNASQSDFDHIVKSQRRLRSLKLLARLPSCQLHAVAALLEDFCRADSLTLNENPESKEAIEALSHALEKTSDEVEDSYQLQVYVGLDSGFHTPSGGQFWAVWEVERKTASAVIYISKSVQDIIGVLIHLHLSRMGFSRYHCFQMEHAFSRYQSTSHPSQRVSSRLQQDLQLLSTTDILLCLQHLQFSEWDKECPLLSSVRKECEELLIELPTYDQFKRSSNMDYISGTITDEQLVNSKLKWHRSCGLPTLDRHDALRLFRHITETFHNLLCRRDHEKLDAITLAIETLTSRSSMDSVADFVLFCIFCAARKAGFDEVYIEVSDRNPLFNQYTDQSAAFAELFALGSRCEAYFDIKPSDIGVLLSKRHRDHYNQKDHQPPMWIFNAPSFASAYAAAQTDIDPEQKTSVMPAFRRFSFLSVFAIPALVGEFYQPWERRCPH